MQTSQPSSGTPRYRPSTVSVFAAAFVAGAVVAFGLNRMLDVHLAQSRPQVESVPIFVALRSLPQGAPVTVWDVALRDWPKAMLPTTALKAEDSFEGMILKHPLREGQPLLSVQLMQAEPQAGTEPPRADEVFSAPTPASRASRPVRQPEADLWAPVSVPAHVAPPADNQPPTVAHLSVTQPTDPQPTAELPVAVAAEQLPTVAIATTLANDATLADATTLADDATLAADATTEAVTEQRNDPVVASSPEVPAEPEHVAVASDEVTEAIIEDRPTEPTLADSQPPVPASPVTDIERSLKSLPSQRFANLTPAFTDTPYSGPAVAESVLTDAVAPGAGAMPPADDGLAPQPPRYLVVPERIALEADSSFAAPPATAPVSAPSGRGGPGATRPQPKQIRPQAATTPPQTQRPRGALFPNMAAGLEAFGAPLRGSQATPPTRAR